MFGLEYKLANVDRIWARRRRTADVFKGLNL